VWFLPCVNVAWKSTSDARNGERFQAGHREGNANNGSLAQGKMDCISARLDREIGQLVKNGECGYRQWRQFGREVEGEGPQTRGEGKYSAKRLGAGRLCDNRSANDTRAGGADVECADMGRMVDWHVIQERLEPRERWYGDRAVHGGQA
jgi:hypothetical protein